MNIKYDGLTKEEIINLLKESNQQLDVVKNKNIFLIKQINNYQKIVGKSIKELQKLL